MTTGPVSVVLRAIGPGTRLGSAPHGNRSPRRRPPLARAAAPLLLVAALLGGCAQTSSGPLAAARIGPAAAGPSAAETVAAEPSEPAVLRRPPVWSTGMDDADGAGAVAATEHFLELFAYAQTTGDLLAWNLVSGEACAFCASVREDVTQVYDSGGRYTDYDLTIGPVVVLDRADVQDGDVLREVFTVEAGYRTTAGQLLGRRGAVLDEIPAEAGALVLDVTYADIGWMMLRGEARTEELTR
ncbi:DUF6318 family protein [Actinotalea sp. K2]|uniref:DUF6318 family protein n=1 Tax=Actinotalea sp. K2 TaxID=2939438 RepID=UPI002017D26B|nr:DUF6318 family protein [Actinotalea sp. K2]MCL3861018.1 DUF6318 family protein [Actinotalea sp. K2]